MTVALPFVESGTGDPLVLVHAFPLDARMYRPQMTLGVRRVIAPDLRGFGAARDREAPSVLADHADDLARLLDALGLKQVTLAGVSMGGYIALAFAAKYADRLSGLVLADTRAGADSAEGKANRDRSIATVKEQGVAALVEGLLPKLLAAGARESVRGEVRSLGVDQGARGVIAALEAMRDRPDRTSELSAIRCPVRVIVGKDDAITPESEAVKMVEALPDATLTVLPGAGHLSNLESPEAFNRALLADSLIA